jgi:hypothetical protein
VGWDLVLVFVAIFWREDYRGGRNAVTHDCRSNTLRLDLQSFLPRFAIIDTARDADSKRAWELCAGIKEGEIVIFDRAYVDFDHLWNLERRGVTWVTRAKENLQFELVDT